jgi:RNA ligase
MFNRHEELVKEGYLVKSTLDNLVLYNYTDKCTFDNFWIPETLNSRGTIYDNNTGKVVSWAFPKFFNINQRFESEIKNLPNCDFNAYEKVDGSFGTQFIHNNQFMVATRGSFYSEQAVEATKMLNEVNPEYLKILTEKNINLVFEIVYPENKIIIDYGTKRELVILGGFYIDTGKEIEDELLKEIASLFKMRQPKYYDSKDINFFVKASESIPSNEEGWVLRFNNGFRVKVKGKEYMELAKFKFYMSPISVWEAMRDGKIGDRLLLCPDEFQEELKLLYKTLKNQFYEILTFFNIIPVIRECYYCDLNDKKETAIRINKLTKIIRGYCFAVLSKNFTSIEKIIYELIRPDSNKLVDLKEIKNRILNESED